MWEGMGAHSSLNVPLEVNGARRGVLQADAERPEAFTVADQQFLAAVARWVGMVAHRAELAEQLVEAAKTSVGQHHGPAYKLQAVHICQDLDLWRKRLPTSSATSRTCSTPIRSASC